MFSYDEQDLTHIGSHGRALQSFQFRTLHVYSATVRLHSGYRFYRPHHDIKLEIESSPTTLEVVTWTYIALSLTELMYQYCAYLPQPEQSFEQVASKTSVA